jgi:hypothetical protein
MMFDPIKRCTVSGILADSTDEHFYLPKPLLERVSYVATTLCFCSRIGIEAFVCMPCLQGCGPGVFVRSAG